MTEIAGKSIRADGLTHAKALRQRTQCLNQDGESSIATEAGGAAGTRAQGRCLQITEDATHWAEASALHHGGPGGAAPSPNVADI